MSGPRSEHTRRSSGLDVQGLKKALTDAGIEIYRIQGTTLQIAERVRLHIMDSGIRVTLRS